MGQKAASNAQKDTSYVYRLLVTCSCVVVVIAGLRAAQDLVVPFLLSVFIALVVMPALYWMKKWKIPTILAIVLLGVSGLVFVVVFAILIGNSMSEFQSSMPVYQEKLRAWSDDVINWLNAKGVAVPRDTFNEYVDLGAGMRFVARLLSEFGSVLTNALLIVLTVIFLLLEAAGFPAKLKMALKQRSNIIIDGVSEFSESLKSYIVIKTVVSLLTGVAASIYLAILGVEFAVLWGLLAFLFNYVPAIGSIVAAIPVVLLAVVQLGGGTAVAVIVGYSVINVFIGNIIEPRYMAKGLGLSPLVVFLSLVFWGWVFGFVGALLSIPLTMTLKIALERSEETRWFSVLLGPEVK